MEATAWTRDHSPNVPKPEPSYGYAHGEPSGNRGEGRTNGVLRIWA